MATQTTKKTEKKPDLQHVGPNHWVAYSSRDPENVWYHLTKESHPVGNGRERRHWVCTCPGFINYHHCYHMNGLMEILHNAAKKAGEV